MTTRNQELFELLKAQPQPFPADACICQECFFEGPEQGQTNCPQCLKRGRYISFGRKIAIFKYLEVICGDKPNTDPFPSPSYFGRLPGQVESRPGIPGISKPLEVVEKTDPEPVKAGDQQLSLF